MIDLHQVSAVLITREESYPKDIRFNALFGEVIVEERCPSVFRRWELAAFARHPTIYVQDDDIQTDPERLWKQSVYGSMNYATMPGHLQNYAGSGVALIGFGAFFPRVMAQRFLQHQAFWREKYGDAIFESEADRFATWENRHDQRPVIMAFGQKARSVKMCERPGHYALRDRLLKDLRGMS